MARGGKQIEGQLTFDFCLDTYNFVVQSNSLIGGRQALKLNSAKLIRAAIMQIKREDFELKPYIITIAELAKLLGISKSNIYRDIDDITNDILSNPVYVREEIRGGGDKKIRWIKMPWCVRCEYHSDIGLALKLNDELKPLLLNLQAHYTQYSLEEILVMKSVYAIRLYELLLSKIVSRVLPKQGIVIELSLDEIRECCGCEGKSYCSFGNLRNRVIDKGVKEINEKTIYKLSYEYVKKGKTVVALAFHMNVKYHV